jgi:hypothetical protein
MGLIYNLLNLDNREFLEDQADQQGVNVTTPKYISIPFLVGIQLEPPTTGDLSVCCEIGGGLSFLKMTSLKYYDDEGNSSSMSFAASMRPAYKIGAGLVYKDKYTFGVKYMSSGKFNLQSDNSSGSLSISSRVSVTNIVLGMRF